MAIAHSTRAQLAGTSSLRRALRLTKRGNDGLTDTQRHASAERWRNGAGRAPSKEEMNRLRGLTPVTHKAR